MPAQPMTARAATTSTIATRGGLRVDGANKSFHTPEGSVVEALQDVELRVAPGEFFVMLGPSGCGKTTLLRSIAGLEVLDSGSIQVGGQEVSHLSPSRRPVNTVFQSYALFPHMTVSENIAFGLQMERRPKAEIAQRVDDLIAAVHLDGMGDRKPDQLSGGQQQRVALARALARKPEVVLLDEPLSALDLKLRREMQEELKRLQREAGITFIFVTHDQEEALSLGDRIAVFNSGRIAQIGTPTEIYEQPADRFVASFIGETNFVTGRIEGERVSIAGSELSFLADEWIPRDRQIEFSIRPERIMLESAGVPGSLPATIVRSTYMGTDLRHVAVLADGSEMIVRASPPFGKHRSGDRVGLMVDPADIRYIPGTV